MDSQIELIQEIVGFVDGSGSTVFHRKETEFNLFVLNSSEDVLEAIAWLGGGLGSKVVIDSLF